jgi:hypothetical protein
LGRPVGDTLRPSPMVKLFLGSNMAAPEYETGPGLYEDGIGLNASTYFLDVANGNSCWLDFNKNILRIKLTVLFKDLLLLILFIVV